MSSSPSTITENNRTVRRLAIGGLGFAVAVILGGTVVRATESGAGCGESWPQCDGSFIPVSPGSETIIEFVHRLMSASLGLVMLALGLAIVAARLRTEPRTGLPARLAWTGAIAALPVRHNRKTPMERAFGWAVVFFVGEVLIGAVLVLYGWVDDDASAGRMIAITVHLVNTFLLLGSLAMVVHRTYHDEAPVPLGRTQQRIVLGGVATMLVIGASGALNALADTLYPADTLLGGIRDELAVAAPLLLQLRVLHPVIAILGGGLVFMLARSSVFARTDLAPLARRVRFIVIVQFVIGIVNVGLLTPLELQVVHLLMADALWIAWVFLSLRLATPADRPSRREIKMIAT